MTRTFMLAVQFLTRLPTPGVRDFQSADLTRCAYWFPVVGLLIGALVACALYLGARRDSWLGAFLALLSWVWITGALHLDGLADYADARAAAHRDPTRFLDVLHDPHVGSFGVVAIALALLGKLIALEQLADSTRLWLVPAVAAWARWGALAWSLSLPALAPGTGERFAWQLRHAPVLAGGLALLGCSVCIEPLLVIAPLAICAWGYYLRRTLGGVTGDCLGAGIELTELVVLLAVCGF